MPKVAEPVKKAPAKKRTPTKKPVTQRERGVLYPQLEGKIGWLTAEQARGLLGWKQSDSEHPYKDFLFKDRHETPTRCYNVDKQRPFYMSLALQWMHEILNGHWNGDGGETNGESMIVSNTGLVIDGKHRMVGLVLAEQEWLKNPDKYPYWKEEPKIHCFINFGIREDMRAINTINTGKPRSLADAIYASGLFTDLDSTTTSNKNRKLKALSRMADYAVRLLWHRTGAKRDAFAPKRTHAESLDFIQRHPKLLECLKHIHEEDGGKEARLKYYPSPGYAAALLYLMGSASSIRENGEATGYAEVDCPTEDLLDWELYPQACDFWTKLAAHDKAFDPVRQAIADLLDVEGGSFLQERIAILVKAWWCFIQDLKITPKALEYETVKDEDGRIHLGETPTVGEVLGDLNGIDLGEPGKGE